MRNSRRILGIAFTLGFLVLLWYVRGIVIYLLISVVITLILNPLLRLLDKVRIKDRVIPDWLKALSALVSLICVLYLFASIFTPVLVEEIRILSAINLEDLYAALEGPLTWLEAQAEAYSIQIQEGVTNREYVRQKLIGFLDLSMIPDFFSGLVSGLGNLIIALFSISFITFFLLKDRWIIPNAVDAITPDAYLEQVHKVIDSANRTLSRYFIGLVIQITTITTLVSVSLSILGVNNALVIGFFAGVINVIPYIGPIIGAVFGIAIALTTNLDMDVASELAPFTLKVASVFLTVQLMDNFIFQPLIFSNSIQAHPLEIFLVILVAGQLAGITGMVLAVPTYSFIRIIARAFFSEFKVVKRMTDNMD